MGEPLRPLIVETFSALSGKALLVSLCERMRQEPEIVTAAPVSVSSWINRDP